MCETRIVFLMNVVSPHVLPLAKAVAVALGQDRVLYLATGHITERRRKLGWNEAQEIPWVKVKNSDVSYEDFLIENDVLNAEALVSGIRDFRLFKERVVARKCTLFYSERWAKPPIGFFRLLKPAFLKSVLGIRRIFNMNSGCFAYLPIGPYAMKDMLAYCGSAARSQMIPWGYFVEPSNKRNECRQVDKAGSTRVLWVGRLLRLKHVDTIIQAIATCQEFALRNKTGESYTFDIYGSGPDESRLVRMAKKCKGIRFHPPVPIEQVRSLMRQYDVYVMASNAYEGWGAVVSEALEERMLVLGTHECGAAAAMLPNACLFRCGDVRGLAQKLMSDIPRLGIGEWSAASGARRLIEIAKGRGARI